MTDWLEVIHEIRRHGLTYKAIAIQSEIAPRAVYDITEGRTQNPSESDGQKLLALRERFRKVFGESELK